MAEDSRLRQLVARKAMEPGVAASGAAKQSVIREAQAAGSIKHDHIVTIYGSGHGDANIHDPHELPVIVAGGGVLKKGEGRHIRYSHAQLADLHVTLLNKLGLDVERVGESKGRLAIDS